jgi:hypothetical protein
MYRGLQEQWGVVGGTVFRQGEGEGRSGKPGVLGGGLVTTGGGCIIGEGGEGDARPSVGARNTEGGDGHMGSTLDVGRPGVVGYGIGGTGS